MTPSSTATSRLARLAAVACAVVLTGLLSPSTASAAGTGGIEVTPIPGVVDGRTVTSFRVRLPGDGESTRVPYALRNLTDEPRSARLYVATATRAEDGTFDVGAAGTSDYVVMDDVQVELPPDASEERSFTVSGGADEEQYAAVVVEVQRGSIVQRAATIIYLEPSRSVPIPLLLGLGAGLLVAVAAGAVFLAAMKRERRQAELTETSG